MFKKQLFFLMLMALAVTTASAGTWKIHSYYVSSKIQNVYDTGDKVYYVNSGSLFQFDKTTTTSILLNKQNILSGNQISQIYYDWENNLLFVAYMDNNIDIIDGDGQVYNISNLKDIIVGVRNYTLDSGGLASYTGKTIRDITFGNGVAYVSLDYGYVTIDEATKRITSDNKLGTTAIINSVTAVGNTSIFMSNNYCYYGPLGGQNPTVTFHKYSGSFSGARLYPINETSVFILASSALYNFDFSGESAVMTKLVANAPTSVQKTPSGFIANFAGQNFYYTIDATGKTATKVTATSAFASSSPTGDGTVWINDANGLHIQGSDTNYGVNALTTDAPYWLKYNAGIDRLYVGTSARNGYTVTGGTPANIINSYDGMTWSDVSYVSAGAGYEFVVDPFDPTTYVRASWNKGVHKRTNDETVFNYTSSNSLMGGYKAHPAFDNYGNLWFATSYGKSAMGYPAAVLPRAKYEKTSVTKSDWFAPEALLSIYTGAMQRSSFVISRKNNVKIYTDGDFVNSTTYTGYLRCWDNFNEDPLVDTYQLANIAKFIDQNNKVIKWNYIVRLVEDNDGMIWAGYTNGVFMFDPEVVFDESPKAIRPFVTKFNEGSGYLCDGYYVFDIGVTRDNEKWLATDNGVYHVSADGSEVYNHFTTDNSDLPSNVVYSVECDTVNDRVYIYTDNGFAEYVTDGDAAAMDFSGVYAFPSPVEPDFTGMVKIAGLMENTYVTITDRDGRVVAQMGPVMGRAFWDASDATGERVATGIYNVYVAQGGQPSTAGEPQTTIMVIR